MLEKIEVWYSIHNGGDGSASPQWFLKEAEAEKDQEEHNEDGEGWAEDCTGMVETFVGSNVYQKAEKNSKIAAQDLPTYEAEQCEECKKQDEEGGMEYEHNVTWKNGAWHCDGCGGVC